MGIGAKLRRVDTHRATPNDHQVVRTASIDWGLVISALGVAISAGAFGLSLYTWRRQHAVQTRLAEIEQERRAEEIASRGLAEVVAKLVRRGDSAEALVLWNRGKAEAREVIGEFQQLSHDPFLDSPFPLTLEPNQTESLGVAIPVAFVWGDPPLKLLKIAWVDDSGTREKTIHVSFGD